MESELAEAEIILPPVLRFKKIQMADKYPKGQARGRHWKHLKQILQAENYQNYPPEEPNCKFYFGFFAFNAWNSVDVVHTFNILFM